MSSRLTVIFLLVVSASLLRAAEPVDLRGYGKVAAEFSDNRAVFQCQSVEKADILLDKLQADLFWDKTLPVKTSHATLNSAPVSIYSLPGYGAALIARSNNRVIVLGGADEREVTAQAMNEPLLKGKDVTSQTAKPRPIYLDFYDNRAFKADRNAITMGGWPFLKSFGGGVVLMGPVFAPASPAPGEVFVARYDDTVRQAEKEGEMVVVGPSCGLGMPLWERNAYPELAMRPSDTMSMGEWGGPAVAGTGYESWSTPPQMRWKTTLDFTRRMIERYRTSPNLGGWLPFAGSPGWEYGLHGRSMLSWDHSPAGQEGFRKWLREVRHLTLADVGIRWFGDDRHFSSWDEITVPDSNEFYGKLGSDSLRLRDGWRWRRLSDLPKEEISPQEAGWVPMAMPPSQQMSFVNDNYTKSVTNLFDVTFDATEWIKQNQGKDVWLVFGAIGVGADAARVWLNGKALEMPTDAESKDGPFSLPVTGRLKSGDNHLQVALRACWANSDGRLAGPVFLTAHPPRRLPYMDRQENARCVDLIEWRSWAVSDYHRQTFAVYRKLDPDRPFIFSGGVGGSLGDYGGQMCNDFGMGAQHTGREASYTTEPGAHGVAAGYYGTSEWSAYTRRNDAAAGDMLDRGFGWIMFDADSHHHLVSGNWQQEEKKDQWFSRHRRQIELFGKYLREPDFVVLRSAQSTRYGSSEHAGWNMGRGEFQAAHYDNACVNELTVQAGYADKYPLMFDNGSEFMDAQTVEAIHRYVENGGTFVALTMTGRHAATEPDHYLLSELSGFKTVKRNQPGKITFENNLPVFKGWEGRQFDGWGSAIDWQNADYARTGLSLTATDKDAIALARWDDGTVAIGCRKIGKGRIIILGSTFWRAGKDIQGIWRTTNGLELEFLERLFTDCRVQRKADASVPEIWARRMVTKNGLQNWLISYNSRNETVKGDVWMATDGKPDAVVSLDSNVPVPFVYQNNGVQIRGLEFKPYEIKVFAVRHAELPAAVSTWWHEKEVYWKRTPAQLAAAAMTLPDQKETANPDVITLGKWRFAADSDNTLAANSQWMSETFNDDSWQVLESGPWNRQDAKLQEYRGVGLYRQTITVPPAWKGRRILLNLFSYNDPLVYDQGTFCVNGKEVFTYKARTWSQTFNFDITELVHPGTNVVTLAAKAGANNGGLNGSVWIEAWAPLAPAIDLSGPWQAIKGDWITSADVAIPGTATGKLLRKQVDIPADWNGKTIYVEWSSRSQWVGVIVVNGQPISTNGYGHPYGLWARVNVGMYLKPAQTNIIEVWPFATMTVGGPNDKNSEHNGLQLNEIRIGCK